MSKLYPDDQGALQIAVFIERDQIVLNFGKSVKWVSMGGLEAQEFVKTIQQKIIQLARSTGPGVAESVEIEQFNRFVERSRKAIKGSDTFISMLNRNYDSSGVMTLQLGLALMTGKPIYLLVNVGTKIPDRLRKLADGIEEVNYDDPDALKAAVNRIVKRGER